MVIILLCYKSCLQPAVELRASIRKEKGLPIVIDLLCSGSTDSIVRSASVALRNLALDEKNKELIGLFNLPCVSD